jgi:hypothetical protein
MISTDLEHTRRFFYEPSGTGADSLRQQMTEVNLTRAKVVDILNARRMNQLYVAGFLQLLGVVGLGGSLVVFLLQNFQ